MAIIRNSRLESQIKKELLCILLHDFLMQRFRQDWQEIKDAGVHYNAEDDSSSLYGTFKILHCKISPHNKVSNNSSTASIPVSMTKFKYIDKVLYRESRFMTTCSGRWRKQKHSWSPGFNLVWHEKGTGTEGSGIEGHKRLAFLCHWMLNK